MKKFSVYNYLYEQDEQDNQDQMEIPVQDSSMGAPPQEMDQTAQGQNSTPPSEPTPEKNVGKSPESRTAFRSVLGKTISDVSFEPLGGGGGKIAIKTSSSHMPLEISWVGGKVTVTQPSGEVIMLSKGG